MPQSPTPADPRRALRRELRARRHELASSTRIAAAEAVARHWHELPAASTPGYVAGYWACAGELPLHRVQMGLGAGQVWCLPRITADGALRFAPWRAGDPLVANRYGIPEPDVELSSCLPPQAMQAVLLPLLGFDRRGHRLGTGGGYYDRSFAFRREGTASAPLLVGIGYALQEVAELASEAWDVPLDAVISERELIRCTPAAG